MTHRGVVNLVHVAEATVGLIGPVGLVRDGEQLGALLRRQEEGVPIDKLEACPVRERAARAPSDVPFHSIGLWLLVMMRPPSAWNSFTITCART